MKLNSAVRIQKRLVLRPSRPVVPRATENEAKVGSRNPVAMVLDKYVKPDAGYEMVLFPFLRKAQSQDVSDGVPSDLTEARAAELRRLAARDLTNIDMSERTRRKIFGVAVLCLTAGVDAWLISEHAGFWTRLATTPLLFLGLAYLSSGQMGLCNIAQSGMWQVDGEGLKKIEDQNLADRIRRRVNRFNATVFALCGVVAVGFASVPL